MKVEVPVTAVVRVVTDVLVKCGVPGADAAIVADSILDAHRRGRETHGIGRLPIYVRKISQGLMSPDTPISVVQDIPAVSVIDAHNGFGQVASVRAMDLCVEKATEYGIGVAGVRHSNSFGAAGFIAEKAAKRGMIGVVLGNASPAIAPTGGVRPIFGTNPLAIAFPKGSNRFPIVLDMATSVVARSKIRQAARNGQQIPLGWALDKDGNPTEDPRHALNGSMVPIGNHKGYLLSLAIDILAGLLPGAAFGGKVEPLNHADRASNCGHFLGAINVSSFLDYQEYVKNIDLLVKRVKDSGPPGVVRLPGELSRERLDSTRSVVSMPEMVVDQVNKLASAQGLQGLSQEPPHHLGRP